KDFREKRDIKAQTWHSFFRWNRVGKWTSEHMGEKKFSRVICCDDDAQPPPFFREMPHNWLKEHADYYEKVLTNYCAKCPKLREFKKAIRQKNNRIQSKLFRGILPTIEKWKRLEKPRDGRKQNCLVSIPGSFEKQKLVKNDIVHLPLNTLPEKFIKDI
ncbi:5536_t:CDS:2, partial [Racocetra persica]